jgi:predicted metalloprotease
MKESFHRARPLLIAALLAAALAFAACSTGDAPTNLATKKPASTATPVPSPTPAAKSLEGAFDYNHMQDFLDTVTPMVKQFFAASYPDIPAPRRIIFVPSGRSGSAGCGGAYDGDSYEYCPANDSIYIAQDLLWYFYKIGDAAPVVGLAHEWGHHIQAWRDLPSPRTPAQSVKYEDQADCVAGAWEKYAAAKGWLELPQDIGDSTRLMEAIGSRETRSRDHGTTAERLDALDIGYKQGLTGCNTFVPSTPISES